jgi:hypothetical protein
MVFQVAVPTLASHGWGTRFVLLLKKKQILRCPQDDKAYDICAGRD